MTLQDLQNAIDKATRQAREEAKAQAELDKGLVVEAAKAAAREELQSSFAALVPAMFKWSKENINGILFRFLASSGATR